MVDVEEKVEYKVEKKSGAEHDIANAADKVKAGAKAMGKKVTDPTETLEQNITCRRRKKYSINFFFYCIYIII
jgi:hypothetical protein